VDNDPVALKVARENLRCNGVTKLVRLSNAGLSGIRKSFPLVVANLTAETIVDLAAAIDHKVALKGFLILSGILNPMAKNVIARFSSRGFRVVRRKMEKEWTTLLFRRR
jgi:ribosomal protein L11 methyltransferase